MLDHSWYMLKTPLGSMRRRVDETRSWMGRERKQSLRRPRQLASAVQTSRRAGGNIAPASAAPDARSEPSKYAKLLRRSAAGVGVDCGRLREDGDETGTPAGCFNLLTIPAAPGDEASVWSARAPPPVTKKVSSKTTSAGGDGDGPVCSAFFQCEGERTAGGRARESAERCVDV